MLWNNIRGKSFEFFSTKRRKRLNRLKFPIRIIMRILPAASTSLIEIIFSYPLKMAVFGVFGISSNGAIALHTFEVCSLARWVDVVCCFKLNDSFFEDALFIYLIGVRHILNACAIHKVTWRNVPVGRKEVIASFFIIRIEDALNLLCRIANR